MKYMHAGRIITVTRSEYDDELFVETITRTEKGVENTETAYYRIVDNEKVYTGAGGGFIPEDYVNPRILNNRGKFIILENDESNEDESNEDESNEPEIDTVSMSKSLRNIKLKDWDDSNSDNSSISINPNMSFDVNSDSDEIESLKSDEYTWISPTVPNTFRIGSATSETKTRTISSKSKDLSGWRRSVRFNECFTNMDDSDDEMNHIIGHNHFLNTKTHRIRSSSPKLNPAFNPAFTRISSVGSGSSFEVNRFQWDNDDGPAGPGRPAIGM
jgi:hypothetical protein